MKDTEMMKSACNLGVVALGEFENCVHCGWPAGDHPRWRREIERHADQKRLRVEAHEAAHAAHAPPVVKISTDQNAQSCRFRNIAQQIGELVAEKNVAYGNSFNDSGEILRILYPDGIDPTQYDDALAIVRILDKLKRIATDRDALGESPFRDIAGYGILGAERVERQRIALKVVKRE